METKSNKTLVLECYRKIIRDLDISHVDKYVHEHYIQHSPTVKDGKAGLLEMIGFLKTMPKPKHITPSPIIRVIADQDMVAVHLDVRFMGKRLAVLDLMRVSDGKLAEHWDAGQVQPEIYDTPVTMTNGISTIEDSVDVNKSKNLIRDFYIQTLPAKYLTNNFIDHNPTSGILYYPRVKKVHRIIGEGNFVVVQCECVALNKTIARYSIFKIEDDKIAEHWSVEQEVPETMAHNNGMF
jgi:predicted SnoaL-like aldol condensation-catalyzing enzyme